MALHPANDPSDSASAPAGSDPSRFTDSDISGGGSPMRGLVSLLAVNTILTLVLVAALAHSWPARMAAGAVLALLVLAWAGRRVH